MRIEINKRRVRAWRLWLAARLAPTGVHIHDPAEDLCPEASVYLTAIALGELEYRPDLPHLPHWLTHARVRIDVTSALDELAGRYDVIRRDGCGRYYLTSHGERELAKMWGPDRVPPWSWGEYDCEDHGPFDQLPGDRKGCPSCAIAGGDARAVGNAP